MKYIYPMMTILFGIGLMIFGFNHFFGFLPPPEQNVEATEFMRHLNSYGSGYIMKLAAVVQIAAGILLLVRKFIPLAALILFPVTLNAVLFHVFLDTTNMIPAVLFLLFNLYLFFKNADHYDELFDD